MSYKNIVTAIDLGPDTEQVIAYALWSAQRDRALPAHLHLLYVIDYGLTPPAYLLPYMEKEREKSQERLQVWADKVAAQEIPVSTTVSLGRLVETFTTALGQMHADLMVVGHKSHLIRPSSSERLIKSVSVPTLVIRGKRAEGARIGGVQVKKILCAVDFSENSKRAFEGARTLADKSGAELLVLHALQASVIEERLSDLEEMRDADKAKYKDMLRQEAEKQLVGFLCGCDTLKTVLKTGTPYKEITTIALEYEADLIVMGARGMSFVKGMLIGSVSEAVVKSSPCPVLIVH